MNDLDLCLEVVSRSCQPLPYIRYWISRKPLEIEAWFQRTTNRKWHMGLCDPQRCCEAVRSAILATAWLLVSYRAPSSWSCVISAFYPSSFMAQSAGQLPEEMYSRLMPDESC